MLLWAVTSWRPIQYAVAIRGENQSSAKSPGAKPQGSETGRKPQSPTVRVGQPIYRQEPSRTDKNRKEAC